MDKHKCVIISYHWQSRFNMKQMHMLDAMAPYSASTLLAEWQEWHPAVKTYLN